MKNFFKFLLFVILLSAGISALYDYRLKHGGLPLRERLSPEKYTLATTSNVNPKEVATLETLSRERRTLVSSVIPSVVSVKTSRKIAVRRQYGLDPPAQISRLRPGRDVFRGRLEARPLA